MSLLRAFWARLRNSARRRHDEGVTPEQPRERGDAATQALRRAARDGAEADRALEEMRRRGELIREERRRNHFAPTIFDAMRRRT